MLSNKYIEFNSILIEALLDLVQRELAKKGQLSPVANFFSSPVSVKKFLDRIFIFRLI